VGAAERVVQSTPPPAGVRVEVGGENEEMRRSFRELGFAFALALLLVYMVLAAKFESFVHPLIILLSVPLGLVGALLALWLAGAGLNTMSVIGIVVMAGIANNDAVVKVDFINQMRRGGMALREAVLAAGQARLRPILMTSATTMLGLLPMALAGGRGAELRAPLAVAIFGGLLSATALTLIVIPVLYEVVEEVRERVFGSVDKEVAHSAVPIPHLSAD
jgi:hydrophobic/amphiphilic exporter-1 (mainly G- bacteria), HAE1 family